MTVSFTRHGLRHGMRRSWPLAVGSFAYGIGFGAMADQAGLAWSEAVAMSALVYAGAAQIVALGIWSDPIPLLAVWLGVFAVNARYVLLGATLRPWLAGLAAHRSYATLGLISDGTWAMALRERTAGRDDAAFLVGSGLALWVAWVSSTGVGHALGAVVGEPRRLGLDFLLPAFCAVMAVALWRGRRDAAPVLAGAGAAALVAHLAAGPWHVVAGVLAGGAIAAVRAPNGSGTHGA
ncbi:hypothetical protein STVA_00420 [Allostella vacuolata]|nr:hypothetical protein STVA_00420 [Stella vacuolata]